MKMSVWEKKIKLPEFNKLCGNAKTDVLVIGGGMCGILCAYFLKKAGIDYVLLEGNRIASGITKNTTAKITSQHGIIYNKLIKSLGTERAQMYLQANQSALKEFAKICDEIDCDFERKDALTYSVRNRRKIEEEVLAVNSLDFPARFIENPDLPFETKGAICFTNQAQFNPMKFIAEISKDLNIYENTFIMDIAPHEAIFENGRIKAEKIIVATHFPFINKHGSYFLKLYQHRSYVSAFEKAEAINAMYVDEDKTGMSLRTYGDLLLVGGGGHRTGKNGGAWNEIRDAVRSFYPKAKVKYEWAAQDCMSLDSVPYIGQYSKRTPDLYAATGFNKWGMTSSMAAAQILCDMVQGEKNEWAEVFSPHRSIVKPQLLVNGFETTKNLLTPTVKRCPHLGCALKWNKAEHTWDCPCHGSRFEENGKLIDNPATGDANVDK